MTNLLCIAGGGALGALLRFWASNGVHALVGRSFPWGTLAVNVSGSFAMGMVFVFMLERMDVGAEWRAAIMTGLLGAFTTFSTFSMETLNLVEAGDPGRALANVVMSVVLCLAACWLGVVAGRVL